MCICGNTQCFVLSVSCTLKNWTDEYEREKHDCGANNSNMTNERKQAEPAADVNASLYL